MPVPTDTDLESVRADLIALGAEREVLNRRRTGLRQQIRYAVLDAYEAGVPVVEIADLVGMTRRAVYDVLDESDAA